MIRATNPLAEARRTPGMAGTSTVAPDWAPVAARIRAEATDSWDDKVAVDRFVSKGGHFVRGYGQISGPREVTVGTPDGGTWVFAARRGIGRLHSCGHVPGRYRRPRHPGTGRAAG